MGNTTRLDRRSQVAVVQTDKVLFNTALYILETHKSANDLSYCMFVVFQDVESRDTWLRSPCAQLSQLVPAQCIIDGLTEPVWFDRVLGALNVAAQSKKLSK